MGLPRSTFYDALAARLDDAESVNRMQAICDEFEAYGYRRVGAALRHHGVIVNHKKIVINFLRPVCADHTAITMVKLLASNTMVLKPPSGRLRVLLPAEKAQKYTCRFSA